LLAYPLRIFSVTNNQGTDKHMAGLRESEPPKSKRVVFIVNQRLQQALARLDNDRASLEAAVRRLKSHNDAAEKKLDR
jgi:hypothetical protein